MTRRIGAEKFFKCLSECVSTQYRIPKEICVFGIQLNHIFMFISGGLVNCEPFAANKDVPTACLGRSVPPPLSFL